MRPLLALTICFAATLAALPAFAQNASSAVAATSNISEPASISVVQNLSFNILPQTLSTGLVVTSSAVNGINANVLVGGALNSTVSVSVPASITVERIGGVETVTVRTVGTVTNVVNTGGATSVTGVAAGGLFNTPVTVTGTLDGGVLSFNVGGEVTIANNLVPGEYHGVLTVVAQYN